MALPTDPALRIVTDAQFDGHAHAWGDVTGKPTTFPPSGHAGSHATGGADPITPASIGAVALQDTGWRVVTSWDETGTVTGDPLPEAVTPATGKAGAIMWRRRGPRLALRVTNADITAAGSISYPSVPFRPLSSEYQWGVATLGVGAAVEVGWGSSSIFFSGGGSVTAYGMEISIDTDRPFPPEPYPGTPA